MRNITVAINDQTYRNIRVWCALRDTSVSRVVQTFLNDLPRLENVRRFPTPEAPEPGSFGEQFDQLDPEELQMIREGMAPLPSLL